jgi:hypothetical protein
MGTKNKITEENYQKIMLKRSIIICWVLLAICFAIKIVGGNFFQINCTNEKFIRFCEYCDTSFIRYIIYFICFMIETISFAMIITPKTKLKSKRFIFYCVTSILFWIIKVIVETGIVFIATEIFSVISLFVLHIILTCYSKSPLKSLLVILYQLVLVVLSSIIRDISFSGFMTTSFLVTTIFLIDYYISLTLTVLYRKKYYKEKDNGIS